MTFRVGQKVVCVDASGSPGKEWNGHEPTVGRIYTVSGFCKSPYREAVNVFIAELTCPIGYQCRRFRPIIERKTDISFAHEILRKTARKQKA